MEQERRKSFIINVVYFGIVIIGVLIISRFLLKYLMPFIIGGIIAYLVQKPSNKISEKIKVKTSLIAAVLAALVFVIVSGVCIFALVRLISSAGGLLENISNYANSFLKELKLKFGNLSDEFSGITRSVISNAVSLITGWISSFLGNTAKAAPSFLISLLVSVVASCYMAADYKGFVKFLKSLISEKSYERIIKVKSILNESVFLYIKGYGILILLTFSELLLGFILLKIKYAPLLALLIAIIDVLPVLGTGTVLLPWSVILLLFGNTQKGIWLLVIYAVITIIRNFAEPKIIGKQTGINPLFTLLSMFIGAKLLGVAGIFILPIAFVVTVKYYKNELQSEKEIN